MNILVTGANGQSVLDKTKIKETFGVKVPYWTDSLKVCIKNIRKQKS